MRSTRSGGRCREGQPSIHDARWGRDTIEVILAVLQSSKERREVLLPLSRPIPHAIRTLHLSAVIDGELW